MLVLAAGTFGTQKLLFKMRDGGMLPRLSARLGVLTRTNSESIVGAGRLEARPDLDLTHGVAITSSIHPTADTHVESVRYGKGSNAMGLLQTLMTDGPGPRAADVPRWRQLLDQSGEDPKKMLRMLNPKQWSERTMIALVMQHLDNSITTYTRRDKLGVRRMTSKQGHGEPNPTWIPAGNEVTRRIAEKIDGVAGGTWGELFNIPLTAHFLGGAAIGDGPEQRRDRPLPTGVRLSDAVGDGRCGDLGQPRGQPVTVDHRAGGAGGVAVAEQGRGRPASGPGRAIPSAGSGRAEPARGPRRCTRRVAPSADRTGQLGGIIPPGTGGEVRMAACAACGVEPLRDGARFCDACGAPLDVPASPAEFKQVTVLFADVVGSMDIAATVGAERLREIMAEPVRRGTAVVQRYGGTMDKFTGDGLMAVFGAPIALEDHAIRAGLAALGIQTEAAELARDVQRRDGITLRLRVGLNSGQVIAGEIGSGAVGYTTIGEQVGLAQRMESVAEPGAVMVSEATAHLLTRSAVLGEHELVRIKGSDTPTPAHRLLAIEARHGVAGSDSNLIGRRWEMGAAEGLLDRCVGGRGGVLGLVGPPGIGKSRLAREAGRRRGRSRRGRGLDVL